MTADTPEHVIALTGALQSGSVFAFEELFKVYRDKVYAYFLHKTGQPEDARDLVQNTFARLWHYRTSLSADFLIEQQIFHIARTVYVDHLRRAGKHAKILRAGLGQETAARHGEAPEPAFEVRDRLDQALSLMPAVRRKVFYLNRVEGYSYREIAEQLSLPVKTIDNNLTQAVRQLRKVFAVFLLFFLR